MISGGSVAIERRHRVEDAVRTDLAGVVVEHAHAGLDAGAHHERLAPEVVEADLLERADQRRHGAGEDGGVDAAGLDAAALHQATQQDAVLVRQVLLVGGNAERRRELVTIEDADGDGRVPDVDRQQATRVEVGLCHGTAPS